MNKLPNKLKIAVLIMVISLSPVFKLFSQSFTHAGKLTAFYQEENSKPTFYDINGDSLVDLLVGTKDGVIRIFLDDGAGTYIADGALDATFGNTYYQHFMGSNAAPCFGNFNQNTKLDVLIGVKDGTINWLEKNGSTFEYQGKLKDGYNNIIDVGDEAVPALLDYDYDGDLDLFIGNENGVVKVYFNASGSFYQFIDYANVQEWGWFGYYDLDVGENASPAAIDYDNDGDMDLIIGSKNGIVYTYLNNFTPNPSPLPSLAFYDCNFTYHDYENTGKQYASAKINSIIGHGNGLINYFYFGGNTYEIPFSSVIDVGYFAAPTFYDIDSDGDQDLFIGEQGCHINYFENIQNEFYASGFLKDINGDFINTEEAYTTPSFGDFLNNNTICMALGQKTGHVSVYKHTINGFEMIKLFYTNHASAWEASPVFYDGDNDGRLDLYVGFQNGAINIIDNYENELGYIEDNAGNIINFGVQAAPTFTTYLNQTFLYVGNGAGNINSYSQISVNDPHQFSFNNLLMDAAGYPINVGNWARPACATIGEYALYVGNDQGRIHKYIIEGGKNTGNNIAVVENNEPTENSVSVYPNPTKGNINVCSESEISTITVLNSSGQVVLQASEIVDNTIDISDQPEGVYFLKIQNKNGMSLTKKIIKD